MKKIRPSFLYVLSLLVVLCSGMTGIANAGCLVFNGVDSYVEIPDAPQLSGGPGKSLTVETWVFPTGFPTEGYVPILSKYYNWNNKDWGLIIDRDGIIGFEKETWSLEGCQRGNWYVWSSEGIQVNEWSHVAFVFDNDNDIVKVYINGVLKGSRDLPNCDLPDTSAVVWFGGWGPSYYPDHDSTIFSGYIDEARVWDVARTTEEILHNRYSDNIKGSEEGLVAHWDFFPGEDPSVLYDRTGNSNNGEIYGASWSSVCPALKPSIIWNPSTMETVLTPGIAPWESNELWHPCVIYDGGKYKMWYAATTGVSGSGISGIGYAESTDGVNWTNRQIVHGPTSGHYRTDSPLVINEDDTYRMWHRDYYETVAGQWSGYVTHMTSTDGISWGIHQNVLSAQGSFDPQGDGYNIDNVSVLKEGSQYVMWYSVHDLPSGAPANYPKIWKATSTDGITWTNRQLSLAYVPDTWEWFVYDPHVISIGNGGYLLFYTAFPSAYATTGQRLGMATSTDGITWINRQQIGVQGRAPFYFEDIDGTPYLYFSRGDSYHEGYEIARIRGTKVSGLDIITPPDYEVAYIQIGGKYYLDRDYTVTSIPAELSLGTEKWIKTKNDDKRNTSYPFLEFTIQQESVVYVAYDSRATSLPSWLDDFEATSLTIEVTDAGMDHFAVYKKSFPAGSTVTLGGNKAGGAAGVSSNYVVIVQPAGPGPEICDNGMDDDEDGLVDLEDPDCPCTDADSDNYYAQGWCGTAVDCDDNDRNIYPGAAEVCDDIKDNDCDGVVDCADPDCEMDPACSELVTIIIPSSCGVADLQEGDKCYQDRDYTLTSIPAELSTGTEKWIMPNNDDKRNTSACFLEFEITRESVVYVAYDSRATSLPLWLEDFEPTSLTIGVTDAGMGHFNVYKKSFAAGTICLGGNMASGAAGVGSNYLVIVQPWEPSKEICDNGMDDDLDGFVDCEDPDCSGDIACPNVLYVDGEVASSGNGTNWQNAFKTIQEALDVARRGDEIWVAEGTYIPGDHWRDAFQLRPGVALYGGFKGTEESRKYRDWTRYVTILSGDIKSDDDDGWNDLFSNAVHVVIGADNAILDGFTITGGNAGQYYYFDCLSIEHTPLGGGIYNLSSSLTVANCAFSFNSSCGGGAIYNDRGASLAIANSDFTHNSSVEGGGAIQNRGSLQITDSTFSHNGAGAPPGMLVGGGAIASSGPATIAGSIFSHNSGDGGGAISAGSSLNVTNCTFSLNRSLGSGAIHSSSSTTFITNSILWGNTAYGGSEVDYSGTAPTVTYCNIDQDGYAGKDGNIRQDPLFVDPENGDLRIQRSSPCLDAGDPVELLTANYSAGGVVLEVDSVTNISAGDTVWITDGVNTQSDEVIETTATTITVKSGFTKSYLVGDNAYVYTELSDFAEESWPNGARINLGAYGGTSDSTISVPPSDSIVTVNTPTNYLESNLQVGDKYYTDRDYTLTSIPSQLSSGAEKWIMAKNDYKKETSESFLQFTLFEDSVVYVAYDSRATSLPSWLDDFEPTSLTIGVTDVGMGHFAVYKKNFSAGPVTLGGNRASGASDDALSNYIVIVQPVVQPLVTVIKPIAYEVAGLKEGDKYYLDRNYTLISIPAELSTGAEEWIKTKNNDKRNTSACFLEFTIQQESIVYVGYDSRASSLPSWLDDFEPTSLTIGVSDAAMGNFVVFKKNISAGTLCLGGNSASGAAGVGSNYIVIVQPISP